MNIRPAAVLTALLVASSACGTTDNKTAVDVTGITALGTNQGAPASVPRDSTVPVIVPASVPAPIPASVPAPVPTPVPSSSTGPGLSGLAVISDDFTRYASTADLMARITANNLGGTGPRSGSFYGDGVNASLASIDGSVTYNGHATLKLSQPGGVGSTPWLGVGLPSPLTHIWYRVKIRFSPGYTTTGTLTNSANAYKMLSWGWSGVDGSGRLEISNTTEYELYENVQSGPSLTGGGGYMKAGNVSTEWSDGAWYDYVIEVDHSINPGVIRLWRGKDGQPPAYQGQALEKMQNGTAMPSLTSVTIGLNFNQVRAPNQNQAIWWGQWEVVDGTKHVNPFGL